MNFTTTIRISKEVFKKMQYAPTNMDAINASGKGDHVGFVGGLDSADWKENEVLFIDRGVVRSGDTQPSAHHFKFVVE